METILYYFLYFQNKIINLVSKQYKTLDFYFFNFFKLFDKSNNLLKHSTNF